jgi:hypothetical protein
MSKLQAALAAVVSAGVLTAPAVAQEERPDFTGVWTTYRGTGGPGGLNRGGGRPSFTPLGQEKAAQYREVTAGTNHSPGAYCVGSGMPGSMLGSGGYPMEILQHPEQINITYEAHKEIRRVYLREIDVDHNEIWPERNGFSVGYWEGDTLVVETDRLVEQVDSTYAHSDQAEIVERYAMGMEDGKRVITATLTMTDPVFLTEPFTTEKKWEEVPNGRLLNYECTEPEWLDIVDRLMAGEEIHYEGE